jgi:hypothetical protein
VQDIALQPGSTVCHHLHGALEDRLEAAKLLVTEVFGFHFQPTSFGISVFDHLAGPGLGGLDHLSVLHHALGTSASEIGEFVAFATNPSQELFAFAE